MEESIIDILEFDQGTESIANFDFASQASSIKSQLLRKIKETDLNVDSVYFSGDFPSIYFKKVEQFNAASFQEILHTQRQIWNQGRVAFLYVESITEIRIYNCFEKPTKTYNNPSDIERSEQKILLASFTDTAQDLEILSKVFGRVAVESGRFWDYPKYSSKINYEAKVHKTLIANLEETKKKLKQTGIVEVQLIHALFLRSIFLLYLEDRGATQAEFYNGYLKGATSYFDILDNHEATYKLFERLEQKFNGNLSPVTSIEKQIINATHLKLVKECFWDVIDHSSQLSLFNGRAFDFKHIPIELISEIYEEFLKEEEGETKKANAGAYYTPRPLAEFILNKVLPYPKANAHHNYNVKVLDPTCGSGIFLVESLNRLLDRWEIAHPNNTIDFNTISQITKNNIFGIETNSEAIKVTAFSLYLTMLDRLNPKTLWNEERFPYLIYDPNSSDAKYKKGANLFRMSSLSSGPFEKIEYDVIVGNPPWKRKKLDEEPKAYLDKLGYPQELVMAFLHRAATLSKKAKIALVSSSKVLFNTGSKDQKFRKDFFTKCDVEEVFNFSILRKVKKKMGGNLFASAVGPACIFFYRSENKNNNNCDTILYCAPKTASSVLRNKIIDGIVIDTTDVKHLPRKECQNPSTKIWKVAMWGTERDFKIISEFFSKESIKDRLDKEGWHYGNGYQTSQPLNKEDQWVSNLPTVHANSLKRYSFTSQFIDTPKKFRRIGKKEAYKAPHILLKEGFLTHKVCVSYSDVDCAFRDGIYGISSPIDQEYILKALVAYLNSKLARYLLFLSSSSEGIERERIMLTEYLSLPFLFKNEEETLLSLSKEVDKIIHHFNNDLLISNELAQLEQDIDHILYDHENINLQNKYHINHIIDYELDMFWKGTASIAHKPATVLELDMYAKLLCQEQNKFLAKTSDLTCWASVYHVSPKNPLNIISIHFNKKEKANTVVVSKEVIHDILRKLDRYCYSEFSESIYFRKSMRYYKKDTIHIIYPNEKRFWTQAMALNEVDKVISEILSTK